MRVLVVLATSQEADNIVEALERLRAAVPRADILVVDDSSPDGTADLAREASARLAPISVVELPRGLGLGAAVASGMKHALDNRYEVVAYLDADLSHDPADLPRLLRRLADGSDLVLGSRWIHGGSVDPAWPIHRRLLSRAGNRYAALALRLPVRDATTGYRVYRTSIIDGIADRAHRARGYAVEVETVALLHERGARIAEEPIRFTERRHGASKMTLAIAFEAMALVTWWGLLRAVGRWPRGRSRPPERATAR